jgi:hypothetical protein
MGSQVLTGLIFKGHVEIENAQNSRDRLNQILGEWLMRTRPGR